MNQPKIKITSNDIETKILVDEIDISNRVTGISIVISPEGSNVLLSIVPDILDYSTALPNVKVVLDKLEERDERKNIRNK